MLPINRGDCAAYAEHYSNHQINGTQFLIFRDVPQLIRQYVNGTRTLDYGCGLGRSTRYLKSLGLKVDGVDINKEMINCAYQIDPGNGQYNVLRNGEIPSRSEKYDFVFSSFVLVEIGDREQLCETVAEIARVTKKGGTFIAIVNHEDTYNRDWLSQNTQFDENKDLRSGAVVSIFLKDINLHLYDYFWTDDDYQTAMKKAGFSVECVHEPLGKDEDGYPWVTEKEASPARIYVARKL